MRNLILGIDKKTGKLGKTIFSPLGKVVLGFLCAGLLFIFAVPKGTYSAVQTVNLNLSGTGASALNISDIKPGDNGVQSITIRNTGSQAGKVTIWLNNIAMTKSAAVAPRFGTTPQIDHYLQLSLSGTGVTSNLSMPTAVSNFPQSATSSHYVRIDSLDAGASADLTWNWNLPAATDNQAQGDSITFDINYMIEELPAPVPAPTTPTPVVPVSPDFPVRSIQIVVPGVTLVEGTTDTGAIDSASTVTANSTQTSFSISLAPQTVVTNPNNPDELPQKIEAVVTQEQFPPLPGWSQLSPVFDVEGVTYGQTHSLVLDKAATISIGYDPNLLPPCYEDIGIFYFDETTKTWVRLEQPPGYVAEIGTESALTNHFSIFCVLVKSSLTGPAKFEIQSVSAGPSLIRVGDETTVKVGVNNTGGQTGDYKVTLMVNGVPQQSQTVTLDPMDCKEIYFSLAPDKAGKYQVQVGDQTFDVTVVNPPAAPQVTPTTPTPAQPNVVHVVQKVIVAASPYTWLILLAVGIVALVALLFRTKSAQ